MTTAKKTPTQPRADIAATASDAVTEKLRIKTAKAWRPEPGDMISGTVVTVLRRSGGEYADYPMLILDTGNSSYTAVHAMHSTLLGQLKELRPTKGTPLTIVYSGRETSKKRKDSDGEPVRYHSYAVVTDGTDNTDHYAWDDSDGPGY